MMNRTWIAVAAVLGALPLHAQQPAPAVTRAPGPHYESDGLLRTVGGENWREIWVRPLTIPVLDLNGLKPEEQGGGNQSITLHFVDSKGNGWVFRSLDKFPERGLPRDLKNTFVQTIVEDQVSAMHPGGHFVVPRLLEALDILHVSPQLYVMPDDARLGEFRETFAGMIGVFELKPNEGPNDTPGFGGATKIKGSEEFLKDLEESPEYRLDEREYLRARLVDILLNDTDRGTDQWRWARFGRKGDYVYRPIPRDRDWVLVNSEGPVALLARNFLPKQAAFDDRYPPLEAFTFSSHVLDRRLLTRLTRADFDREVAHVQQRLTDDVLRRALHDLPAGFVPDHADEITSALVLRRDRLGEIVNEWYEWLASEVDVRATDVDDRVAIEHLAEGGVRVRIARAAGGDPYYQRTFLPSETKEVRVYLHGGDDRATVSGRPGPVVVRVIGGGGDDVLEDRAGQTRFYDARGNNRFVTADGTRVSEKAWNEPAAPQGLRFGRAWVPDYGNHAGLQPAFGYSEGAGVLLGAGWSQTQYGFRHAPYDWKLSLKGLYATSSGGFGGAVEYDHRLENSRLGYNLDARASQFEAFRFFGYGNDTEQLDRTESLVMQDQARVFGSLTWDFGPQLGQQPESEESEADARPFLSGGDRGLTGSLRIGPVVQWTRARPPRGNPLYEEDGGREAFTQLGAGAVLALQRTDRASAPRRGWALDAEAGAFPGVLDAESAFGHVRAVARGYLPLLGETHLALRAGGEGVLGDAPPFESAFIGGRTSLRGFRYQRFAGDAAAFGSAELRIPIDTVKLVLNGELGVYGLVDAGRVWFDGDSPGGWHTGTGAGVWFSTMNRSLSLTYARGERNRWYLWAGLPF